MRGSESSIVEDVLPVEVEQAAVPVELDRIWPWHRSRKQFIRERQWVHFARRLVRQEKGAPGLRGFSGGTPEVQYLTLPGLDYLDVRLLGDMCRAEDCCLTSTGFYAGEDQNPFVARALVRQESLIRAGYITRNSMTLRSRFEEIANVRGEVSRELLRRGPFHIVNVDTCGSIIGRRGTSANSVIAAIQRLIEFQLTHKAGRWLLFLSADVTYESMNPTAVARFCDAIIENACTDNSFADEVLSMFGQPSVDVERVLANIARSDGHRFLQLFSLGFAKWIIHLVQQANWTINTHSAYCYLTAPNGNRIPTMVCLSFEFIPPRLPLLDRFQVADVQPTNVPQVDGRALRAIEKVSELHNLDGRLDRCAGLRNQLVDRTRSLLKEAGYPDSILSDLD